MSQFVPPGGRSGEPEVRFGARLPRSLHAELKRIAEEERFDLEVVVDHFLWCAQERFEEWLPPVEAEVRAGGKIRGSVLAALRAVAKKRGYNVNRAMEICLARAAAEYWSERSQSSKAKNSAGQK